MGVGRKKLPSEIRWSVLQSKYSLHKSLNQESSLARVCVSLFSLSREFLPAHSIGPAFSVQALVTRVSCSSKRKGIQETFLQFLSLLWPWKLSARAPFPWTCLDPRPWASAAELHQSPWAQHHANYSKGKIKALKGWHFIWMLFSFVRNVNLPFLSGKWIW